MRLTELTAVVTGGASGLGAATADRLSQSGARVVIVDRNRRRGQEVAADLGVEFVEADVTDVDGVQRAVDVATSRAAPLRLVVNCAGGGPPLPPMLAEDGTVHDLESWQQTLDLNVTGTFNMTRLAGARIAENEEDDAGLRGLIVTVSSSAAFQGPPDLVAYSTAKSAIIGFTVATARAYGPFGIRVVCVAPGTFRTPAVEGFARRDPSVLDTNAVAPRRLGDPEEFAALVAHIAQNDYLNAQVIRLDAGAVVMW